ncbi:MAG: carboxypeptidase-like regulatory domain-containing protein, partial [Gemmatimonadaceae bacterium]|nr:carboxypeptidase-like regulatory domain-containing protein [Gemmatimonadaceae bacterium]
MQLSSFVARGPAGRMMPVLCVIGGAVGALALALPRFSQAQEHDPRVPVSVDARQPLEDRRNAKPATTRTVSLHLSGVPLVDVVHEVEAQSELHVTYSSAIVPTMRSVTVNVSDVGPLEALRAALRGTGIEAVLVAPAGPIVLRKAADEGSPTGTITGTVFDLRAAQPVPSAMVHIEGTQLTTIAGTDGHFRIAKVPPGTYLVVARQIGFKKGVEAVTVQAGAETTQNFLLEPSASLLDQVVVTSTLAPTEIRALPTPITVIAAADIETAHLVRTNDIFRGEVPGAFAWDQGTNNTYGRVVVRGASSLLGLTSIKTYIDGIEVSNAMFAVVDPNSIDHIEIIRGP